MLERAQGAEVVQVVDTPAVDGGFSGADTDARLIGLWLHGKSAATVEAYRSDLAKFMDFTEGKPLSTVTLADFPPGATSGPRGSSRPTTSTRLSPTPRGAATAP